MSDKYSHLTKDAALVADSPQAIRFAFIERDRVIETLHFQQIQAVLDELFTHEEVIRPPNVAIFGTSGIGKSLSIEEFMRTRQSRRDLASGILKVPVLHVEFPPLPTPSWFVKSLLQELGHRVSLPYRIEDRFEHLLLCLQLAGTRLIIIQEVSNLELWPRAQFREFYGLIRWLSNRTRIPFVIVGTEFVASLLDGDIQIKRRFARMELLPWQLNNDFVGFVTSYIRTLPLRQPTTVDRALVECIYEMGEGITDTVVKVMKTAAKLAIASGVDQITLNILGNSATGVPPTPGKRKAAARRSSMVPKT